MFSCLKSIMFLLFYTETNQYFYASFFLMHQFILTESFNCVSAFRSFRCDRRSVLFHLLFATKFNSNAYINYFYFICVVGWQMFLVQFSPLANCIGSCRYALAVSSLVKSCSLVSVVHFVWLAQYCLLLATQLIDEWVVPNRSMRSISLAAW